MLLADIMGDVVYVDSEQQTVIDESKTSKGTSVGVLSVEQFLELLIIFNFKHV